MGEDVNVTPQKQKQKQKQKPAARTACEKL